MGWSPIAALGTLALAAATVWLAWKTRALAAAAAEDGRAQWRPVILPDIAAPGGQPAISHDRRTHVLSVRVRNAGRGPALFVRTQLEFSGGDGGRLPERWSNAALAPGDSQYLTFSAASDLDAASRVDPDWAPAAQLLLDYRDLSGREFGTAIILMVVGGEPVFFDVRTWEGHGITGIKDFSYPPSGLRDASPTRKGKATRTKKG